MNDVIKRSWAGALSNEDFMCVETYSGYRSCVLDPKGLQCLLNPDVNVEILGAALLDSLACSRFVLPAFRADVWIHPGAEFDGDLYDYKKSAERHEEWVKALMKRYGYKTKRALFRNMMSCSIELSEGLITIRPWHHEKLEEWSGDGISKEDYVTLPADSAPSDVGAALRLAFSRCS